jgi:hypothetical protein
MKARSIPAVSDVKEEKYKFQKLFPYVKIKFSKQKSAFNPFLSLFELP